MDTVRRWMTSPAVVISDHTLLPEARQLMKTQHIRRLPVVDDNQMLVGIVTEGDIQQVSASPRTDVREFNMYYRAATLPVKEIMTHNVITVTPETPILELAQQLLDHRIGGVPVVVGDQVVGVITESDIFRRVMAQEDAIDPMQGVTYVGCD